MTKLFDGMEVFFNQAHHVKICGHFVIFTIYQATYLLYVYKIGEFLQTL